MITDTVASAYSVRPYKYATVSTPLAWKEIETGLSPRHFSMEAVLKRLQQKGDLFAAALDRNIATKNDKVLRRL